MRVGQEGQEGGWVGQEWLGYTRASSECSRRGGGWVRRVEGGGVGGVRVARVHVCRLVVEGVVTKMW